jgi:hypothetical protein
MVALLDFWSTQQNKNAVKNYPIIIRLQFGFNQVHSNIEKLFVFLFVLQWRPSWISDRHKIPEAPRSL